MVRPFTANELQQICKILAEGMTGSQLGNFFEQWSLPDIDGHGTTKWVRLHNALARRQNLDRDGKCVIAAIEKILEPVRFVDKPERLSSLRDDMNVVLAFSGYRLSPSSKVAPAPKATTIDQAQERSNRLKADLYRRSVHSNVLKFCEPEFLQKNYFHAVLEATKSVMDTLREKTGLSLDGSALVDAALLGKKPLLAINKLSTMTERNEQQGLGMLIKGVLQMFRNVTAHEPKIYKDYEYQEVLDCFTILSYIHKKLEEAYPTGY